MISKVLFLGSKKLGLTVLKTTYTLSKESMMGIVTFDDSSDERSVLQDYQDFAAQHDIPIHVLTKPSQLKPLIETTGPELVMVLGWYWIIQEELLKKVPHGFIGIHGSLLPAYRGFAPFVWAIINGEKQTGISLFYFDPGIDTGDIVAQKTIAIEENDTIQLVLDKAENASHDLIEEYYMAILKHSAPRHIQNTEGVSYCSVRNPVDGQINWHLSSREVHNFIRAQSAPYPGAFTYLGDKKYYVMEARVYEHVYYGSPGKVAQIQPGAVVVCCGQGALVISDVRNEMKTENIIDSISFGSNFRMKP